MKTINQYIYESLIFEVNTKQAISLAKVIVKEINKREKLPIKEIWDDIPKDLHKELLKAVNNDKKKLIEAKGVIISKYHFSKVDKDLDIIYIQHPDLHFNFFDPDKDRLVLTSPSEDVNSIANEIGHEYSHIVDWAKGNNNGNDTYTSGQDERIFDQFLYLISNTEQKAMKINLKEKLIKYFSKFINIDLNSDNVKKQLKLSEGMIKIIQSIQNLINSKSIDDIKINEFVENLCKSMTETRHKLLKSEEAISTIKIKYKGKNNSYRVYDELKLSDKSRETVENILRILEYKYYIMDSLEHFENFINNDEVTGENRDEAVKEYIKSRLSTYTDGDKNIEKMYNEINKIYKQSCNNYLQDLKNAIKIIQKT